MFKSFLFLALCSPSFLFAKGFEQGVYINADYDRANHPSIFFDNYDAQFAYEDEAKLSKEKTPWSDGYWPRYNGGIAYRWQDETRIFKSDLHVGQRLSREKIKLLSPAEKFDLLNGDSRYNFSKKVLKENPSGAAEWQGICDGWAEASIHFPAGKPKTLTSPSGDSIDFGASDINALLSYYHAKIKKGKVKFLGQRCDTTWWGGRRGCEGMNPGAFHIVLVESLKRDQSFIVDVDRGLAVWNQPVYGYEYYSETERAPSKDASKDAVKEVLINMDLQYISEMGPSFDARSAPAIDRVHLSYWVELDKNNNIVGGSWHEHSRKLIDFAWHRDPERMPKEFLRLIK